MSARRVFATIALVALAFAAPAIGDCLASDRSRNDPAQSVLAWASQAEAGDRTAQYRLAYAYEDGIFVAANPAMAARLYRAAAEQGHAGAQAVLAARRYEAEDFAEARRWAEEASAQGSADAAHLLGRIHAKGQGVAADPATAFRWFLLAELRGHVFAAQDRRATAHLVPADARRAIRLAVSGQPGG